MWIKQEVQTHWFQPYERKRNVTSPNQSISRQQESGIVLHFFSLFLPGIFLLLTGGAMSIRAAERGASFFQHRFLHPAFVQSLTLFRGLSSSLTLLYMSRLNQRQTGWGSVTASLAQILQREIWSIYSERVWLSAESQISGRSHLFGFSSFAACGHSLLS